jgi:hypothetical protein
MGLVGQGRWRKEEEKPYGFFIRSPNSFNHRTIHIFYSMLLQQFFKEAIFYF